MSEFKTYHPIVNFTYFLFIIIFSCFLMHPLCLVFSLVSAFTYSLMQKGRGKTLKSLKYMLPIIILTAIINPIFNHRGETILAYFPDGNPLTFESVIYGICAAVMILSVICWFSSYNEIMTSDKVICIFGKILPSLSLVLSMTLRFVPGFSAQMKKVITARRCMGKGISKGSIVNRIKNALSVLSVMVTWSLENAIETADSMKSRGYGKKGRTSFSIFRFDKRDKLALFHILILGIYTASGSFLGVLGFEYFPGINAREVSLYSLSVFISYFLLCVYPIIIEIRKVIKWKSLK